MGKKKKHLIEILSLIKIEKRYNTGESPKYFYNITLQDINEQLLLVIDEPILENIVGKEITYEINEEGVITDFNLV
jgi:hypothetical protein